jgi:hypothetical protein
LRKLNPLRPYLIIIFGVVSVFSKLVLTDQYTFLAHPDGASQVLPRLQAQVYALRQGSVALWDPYSFLGMPLIGQMEPGIANPFNLLLALAPLKDGHIQLYFVGLWFVALHCFAAIFAYLLVRDLGVSRGAGVIAGVFYATSGFMGNIQWPQCLAAPILAPLVFLFLLRAMRGLAPVKNAAWAGVFLGIAWTGGHHVPPLLLTMTAFGVASSMFFRAGYRKQAATRFATMLVFMALIAAVQLLPSFEYGRRAIRWTDSGALGWSDPIPYPEHEKYGLSPSDLLHVVWPGLPNAGDPFVGVLALSLAALAIWGAFRRVEVRAFVLVAVAALLYAMPKSNVLYGWLYSFVPMVEKAREPMMAVSMCQFAIAVLAGFGFDILLRDPESSLKSGVTRALLWFGLVTFGLFSLVAYLKPTVTSTVFEGDPRIGMIALVGLLLAGVYVAWRRRQISRRSVILLVLLLLIVEQGNESAYYLYSMSSEAAVKYLQPIEDTRDIARYLDTQPNPKRVEINENDVRFNFGQWNRIDSVREYTTGMLEQMVKMQWWQDRLARMYGVGYAISKQPLRPGQVDVFTSRSGLKLFRNPDPFPRAWTVHQTRIVNNEDDAAKIVRDDTSLDLRALAVMVNRAPALENCPAPDRVLKVIESAEYSYVKVDMQCRGLVVISDSWYPGWRAEVDGHEAGLWRVDTVIRGVVVPKGSHEVRMVYRPASVYAGFTCMLIGLAGGGLMQRREEPGADLLA